jgi:hypothetical protein
MTTRLQIQCCEIWTDYPEPGRDTQCPACKSVFHADISTARKSWRVESRNGYYAIDEMRDGSTGTFGNSIIVKSQELADTIAGVVTSAYLAGIERGRLETT